MEFNTIEQVTNYLESLPKFRSAGPQAANFDLSRFRDFCASIGDPQERFASIHVGGTNGKGSTCRLLAAVYEQAGYDTGLYTSPHLLSFDERFRINGTRIPDEALVAFFNECMDGVRRFRLTFFEISTAVAFWWFAREKVDLAVIEVGLGGRLDATNVIRPLLSVITSVGIDHAAVLGNSLAEIAREKAGIIKPSRPVIIGRLPPQAEKEVAETARTCNSEVVTIDRLHPEFLGSGRFRLTCKKNKITFNTDLLSPVQAINIALAWQTTRQLDAVFAVSTAQFQEGVADVRKKYPNRGRFDRLLTDRSWYFDGGHNLQAVQAMKETVRTLKPVSDTVVVLSLMSDKTGKDLMTEFLEFKKIYYHELNTDRAATLEEVRNWLSDVRPFPAGESQRQSLFKDLESELVIFAGSFYFYATVRDWLKHYH